MSVEFRPVSAIPFHYIDERLEKYGIKVERYGYGTVLTGRMAPFLPHLKATARTLKIGSSIRMRSWMQFERSIRSRL